MGHRTAQDCRILVCAPYAGDADSIIRLLRQKAFDARQCPHLDAIAASLDDQQVGVVVLTEEALQGDLAQLRGAVVAQPPWSDIPFILLTARQTRAEGSMDAMRDRLAQLTGNGIVLERPLSLSSLLSATSSAIRSRLRQFDMRDRLAELASQTAELQSRNEELARSREAARESDRRFAAIANSIDQMVWSTRPDGYHDYYNDRWYEYTGVPAGSTDGEGWNGMFHPDDQERAWQVWRHSLASGEPYEIEYRLRHRSGAYRWVLGRAQPLRDETGAIVRWFGTCTDIDELMAAREVLARSRDELEAMVALRTEALEAEMASRMRAEASLRQSQKMEAVGQLTGGIAHDFNNMLTGIMGALDVIRRRIMTRRFDDIDRFMDAAIASAQRAAGLTARLLAFSRRQSLDSKALDANALVLSLEELLRGTLRENISLRIETTGDLPLAIADANQLENAIINLAINARDAMAEGGQLAVATKAIELDDTGDLDIRAGRYVVISVSDTGVGMSAEVLEKAFDPFFTTKPLGQGTGLGLSMVYGFAKQSGGQVRIRSEVGVGTTVSLYLPCADGDANVVTAESGRPAPQGRGQTVLLVEDDASVRLLVLEVLRELSYSAIEADQADAAIRILESDRPIELMVSDVGLPGMNGRQLAEVARQHRPQLPILFITGYAENAAIRSGFLGANMAMITKPFDLDALANKISKMIN